MIEARKAQRRSTRVQTLEDSLFIRLNLQICSAGSTSLPFSCTSIQVHKLLNPLQEASLQITDFFRLVEILFT